MKISFFMHTWTRVRWGRSGLGRGRFLALCFTMISAGLAFAAPLSEAEFHSKVVAIYSFEPHTLDEAEMKAKSDQLDEFWSLVKADPEHMLPLLRKELGEVSHSAFFFYDGSKLLLSLSKDRDDQSLALRSIPRVDLRGIHPTDYLNTVHWFASNGFDAREAAFRILAFPEFKAFIPQHSLTLSQNYALICMLFPMEESLFVNDLAIRLTLESNVASLKSLLLALWYTVTPSGDAAIKKFIDGQSNPAEAKGYAKELLQRKSSAQASVGFSSAQSLREKRRKVMQRPISDEALIDFDKLTSKLLAKH